MRAPAVDPTRYPRLYTPSAGWRAFAVLGGGALLVGGLAGAAWFGMGHEVHGPGAALAAATASLLIAAMGLVTLLQILCTRVTLGADFIEVRNLRSRRVSRSDIVDYRRFGHNGVVEMRLRLRDRRRLFKFTLLFKADADFHAWFAGLVDADHAAREIERRAIELDDRLGATPELRRERVARARGVALWLIGAAVVLSLWTIYDPRPYALALSLTAALPLAAIWLCWQSGGLFSLAGRKESGRGDLATMVILPSIALALRAFRDVDLAVPAAPLVASTIGGVVLALLAWAACSELRRFPASAAMNALFLAGWSYGALLLANSEFDRAPESPWLVTVVGARHTTGKGATAYFTLSRVPADLRSPELAVAFDLYRRHHVGDRLCLSERAGALGWHWIQLADVAGCSGLASPANEASASSPR